MSRAGQTQSGTMTVDSYLDGLEPARRTEAARLIAIFSEVNGFAPVIWSGSMVGFGRHEYRYDSGHSGSSLATGFAARKAELSLYGLSGNAVLLARLGKHRRGAGCTYLKRLEGADEGALRDLIRAGLAELSSKWTVLPA